MEHKTDRRIRKTRTRLLQSLTQLMEQKDIKDISVKELSDLADINRGTFYLHYKDVFDMLEQIENQFFLDFNRILDNDLKQELTSPYPILSDIYQYLYDNKEVTRALIGTHGDLAFVNRLKQLVQTRIHSVLKQHALTVNDPAYLNAFIISGCVGLIEIWMKQDCILPPNEIAEISSNIILKGIALH